MPISKQDPDTKAWVSRPAVFISAPDSVYRLIMSAVTVAGAEPIGAWTYDTHLGYNIEQQTQQALDSADLFVADVSGGNASVMYEIGSVRARQKPVILIADRRLLVPPSLAGSRVLLYDASAEVDFRSLISNAIDRAIKCPELFLLGGISQKGVFISYSHRDRPFVDRLLIHLKPLERDGLIHLWADTALRAGDAWRAEIESALHQARVAILVVSADFLASDFIVTNELPALLTKAKEDGTRVIPLVVRPCRYGRDRNLQDFQAVNDPKRPVVLLTEGEQELLFDQVAEEVERSFKQG